MATAHVGPSHRTLERPSGFSLGEEESGELSSGYNHNVAYRSSPHAVSRESRTPSTTSTPAPERNKLATDSRSSSVQRRSIPKSWGRPPTPPLKDDQSISDAASISTKRESYAGPESDSIYGHMRSRNFSSANSVYSISRVSFTNQITQLTSIQLPEASSLSGSISAIPTAPKAARALSDAAKQIQAWIDKASEVLDGLDARDDVEWAAQAGREGVEGVDGAISKFDSLIQVYVTAVENLQMREDAESLASDELQKTALELEKIIREWKKIKNSLNSVKRQVELAMEWEETCNTTFQEIISECQKLSRQIFEMEEQRHKIDSEMHTEPAAGVDLAELEALVENRIGSPTTQKRASHRYSFPEQPFPFPQTSPLQSPNPTIGQEDTTLLGIFAQMQPLRASLDFVPMKLASFKTRAEATFPTACRELEERREQLEEQWQKLEADAESLRKELGEDRWLLVFRNAGKQALSMIDSVERSITKLDEALDSNTQLRHAPTTLKKVENYEAKKLHYCPAIERVIAIVDRGVKDRLTVNGEIVRLQNDVQSKWQTTLADVKNMDSTLEFYDASKTQQLRDSVSSMVSMDRSFLSSHIDSMGSSPPSSVGVPSRGVSRSRAAEPPSRTAYTSGTRPRQTSTSTVASTAHSTTPASKRNSSLPIPVTPVSSRQTQSQQQKTPVSRSSAHASAKSQSYVSPYSQQRLSTNTPPSARPSSRLSGQSPSSSTASSTKPRWNASTNLNRTGIGHNFRPLAATEPSPYRKAITPVKYTSDSASRRQSSLTPGTPGIAGSTTNSRRTSANYSSPGSALGSPSPGLHPRSASRARRPSSLMLSQSVLADAPTTPGSTVVDVDSPTSTVTQASVRPESSLTNRSTSRLSGVPRAAGPNYTAPGTRSRVTSAGSVSGPSANGKAVGTAARPTLNKKKSNVTNTAKR